MVVNIAPAKPSNINPNESHLYDEFRLDENVNTLQIQTWFVPDVVYIYNPTDAYIYIHSGGIQIPTAQTSDITVPPHTYALFVPYKGVISFGVYAPIQFWNAVIFLRKGLYQGELNLPNPSGQAFFIIPPLPDPDVVADFAFSISPLPVNVAILDFTTDSYGTQGGGSQTWVSGNVPVGVDGDAYQAGLGWWLKWEEFPIPGHSNNYIIMITEASGFDLYGVIVYYTFTNTMGNTRTLFVRAQGVNPVETNTQNIQSNGAKVFPSNFSQVTHTQIRFEANPPGVQDAFAYVTRADIYTIGANPFAVNPGADVQFTDLSTGVVAAWLWDFGDGGTSTEQNPLHTYAEGGTYNVCLTAFGLFGTQDTFCLDVFINVVAPLVESYV